jgi:hypothetical protein
MLDIAVTYNRYKFIGYEFLTWWWYIINQDPDTLSDIEPDFVGLETGNRIVIENIRKEAAESITIKGNDADLQEGKLALRKGGIVTELNLILTCGAHRWQFTVKGESLNISSLKIPYTGPIESAEQLEGAVLEKIFLYSKAIKFIEKSFKKFIKLRLSEQWSSTLLPRMGAWIDQQR